MNQDEVNAYTNCQNMFEYRTKSSEVEHHEVVT